MSSTDDVFYRFITYVIDIVFMLEPAIVLLMLMMIGIMIIVIINIIIAIIIPYISEVLLSDKQ